MSALSGVDSALWDLKAKRLGVPLWQLLGGKARFAVPVYRHAGGRTPEETAESIRRYMAQGYRHIRVQVGVPGQATYGASARGEVDWPSEVLRKQCATPIAMGELVNNPNEWLGLVSGRLIDFIRCHISQIGGLSMARKVAALCELFRIRTAWHGPGDTSPVGHAAQLHLDLATWNFGIQEFVDFDPVTLEMFPGTPEVKDGMRVCNDRPGVGIDIDEGLAAKHPVRDDPPFDLQWGRLRDRDGTIRRP